MEPLELFNCSDIAHLTGVSRQVANLWYKRGKLPSPFAITSNGRQPLWNEEQLEQILKWYEYYSNRITHSERRGNVW
jgi:transposase